MEFPIRKDGSMKDITTHLRSLSLFSIVVLIGTTCKGGEEVPSDQNLEAIVELENELEQNVPSQFASNSFKDFFQTHDVTTCAIKDRPCPNESKTSIFQRSFIKYIKEMYNQKSYAQIISQDGSHIVQFLKISNEMNLEVDKVYIGMRLFSNKVKASELIDDAVLLQLLDFLPFALERYFLPDDTTCKIHNLNFIKNYLENTLLARFTEHFDEFQNQKDVFISNLAQELAECYKHEIDMVQKNIQKIEYKERLRQTIIRFFEIMLGKLIWEPKNSDNIWKSFVGIATGIRQLASNGIINHMDDLDDLLWTLVHRFCFFLDLTGAALPISFYEKIEHDLNSKAIIFLEFKEQDEGISTKKETLIDSLIRAKARAIAYERRGILSMPVMF